MDPEIALSFTRLDDEQQALLERWGLQPCRSLVIHPLLAQTLGRPELTSPDAGFMPTGLYWDLMNHVLGLILCLNHIRIFVQNQSIVTAALLSAVVANSLRWQYQVLASQNRRNSAYANLLEGIDSSLRSGIRDQVFHRLFSIQKLVMQAWVVLITGYSTFGAQGLTRFQAVQIMTSFVYTWWVLAKQEVQCHLGDQMWQGGLALLLTRRRELLCRGVRDEDRQGLPAPTSVDEELLFLQMWCFANISCAISSTALVCQIVGPFLGFVIFIPPAYAKYKDYDYSVLYWLWAAFSCPLALVTFGRSSSFGIPLFDMATFDNLGCRPARPLFAANVVRIALSAALVRFVSFRIPAEWHSMVCVEAMFGGPSDVGWPRFQRLFSHNVTVGADHSFFNESSPWTFASIWGNATMWSHEQDGAAIWPDFLGIVVAVTLPIYIIGAWKLKRTSQYWWTGGFDEDHCEQLLVMATEILPEDS